jgi:hypothetical protein
MKVRRGIFLFSPRKTVVPSAYNQHGAVGSPTIVPPGAISKQTMRHPSLRFFLACSCKTKHIALCKHREMPCLSAVKFDDTDNGEHDEDAATTTPKQNVMLRKSFVATCYEIRRQSACVNLHNFNRRMAHFQIHR